MMSRRYAALDANLIDRQFAAVYRAHAEDEIRHIHIDWHLLERFYLSRPLWQRHVNAWLLELIISSLLLKPRRANVRLIEILIKEFPELRCIRDRLVRAVRDLASSESYRKMMYSRETTPIAYQLFKGLPEFSSLFRLLFEK